MSLDLMSNSPFLYKEVNDNLLGESHGLSDVVFFPCTPSIYVQLLPGRHNLLYEGKNLKSN